MPDEAREVIINREVPLAIRMTGPDSPDEDRHFTSLLGQEPVHAGAPKAQDSAQTKETDAVSTPAEAGLRSDAEALEQQALRARNPEQGRDLLRESESRDS